ncbi:holin [Acinetobacter sp. YH12098]|uniref:holin n=1 Tax=Acinetobacter sp. YH12098 TaxID=2601087 RepID=UPI0015D19AB0|nr:holin [Acinetobacter sp. YH12098]
MSETTTVVAEASAAAIGSKASGIGGAASFAAFFMGINWIGWLSLGIAILGLLINLYFSWQRNHREKEIHRLQVKRLRGQCDAGQD